MNCDLLFSYNNKREYLGLINFRNVISLQTQRVFYATGSNPPTAQGVPALITGTYTGVIVNGVNFGSGKILSYSNPVSTEIQENGRHLWKQIVNVEVVESGDYTNIGSSTTFAGILTALSPHVTNLNEQFSFNIVQNGDYQYSHKADITCNNEPTGALRSGYIIAKSLASGLLASTPPFGYIDSVHSGLYNTLGRRTYSESYNSLEGSVSFDEQFSIQQRDFLKHSVSFDNGIFNVSESATIRSTGVSKADDIFSSDTNGVISLYNALFTNAYTRCQSLYGTYKTVMGADIYTNNLYNYPVQIEKTFDERTQEFTYSVSFTNNPTMDSSYTIDREQSLNINSNGIFEVLERGNLTSYNNKSASLQAVLVAGINQEITNSSSRATSLWGAITNLQKFQESKLYNSRGKKASYSVSYTTDPSFINNGSILTKTKSIQDKETIRSHNIYLILGRKYPLVHNPGQTEFGTLGCSIKANLARPTGYSIRKPQKPSAALNSLFIEVMNEILQRISYKKPLDVYVSKVSYSYTSDLIIELNAEAQYIYAKLNTI